MSASRTYQKQLLQCCCGRPVAKENCTQFSRAWGKSSKAFIPVKPKSSTSSSLSCTAAGRNDRQAPGTFGIVVCWTLEEAFSRLSLLLPCLSLLIGGSLRLLSLFSSSESRISMQPSASVRNVMGRFGLLPSCSSSSESRSVVMGGFILDGAQVEVRC